MNAAVSTTVVMTIGFKLFDFLSMMERSWQLSTFKCENQIKAAPLINEWSHTMGHAKSSTPAHLFPGLLIPRY
jgi:hypothetical protein